MTNKILIVTPPDNTQIDGIRILLVDLSEQQTKTVSDSLSSLTTFPNIVVYMWKTGDDSSWLLEHKSKCDLIFFNAESNNQLIVGYNAAQPNAYYFGTLRVLGEVNQSEIFSIDHCISLINHAISQGKPR